jgi:cob(I)alamin adenosyltransferase
MSMEKGLVHVFTGDGKGKTTAAVGLSIRAKSRGLKVLFVQFMKQSLGGETELLGKLSIEVIRFGKVLSPHFHPEADIGAIRDEALAALEALKAKLREFDLVVLDEFNCLLAENLLTEDEALDFLKQKPGHLELVLTGRGALRSIIDYADHAIEVHEIKRPANARSEARKGIEY